jgi:phage baseplate assembly protein V
MTEAKLFRRIQGIMSVGTISSNSEEANGVRTCQTTHYNGAQVIDSTPHIQEYGFSSAPLPGCHHIGISTSGDKGNLVVLATTDSRYRPISLAAGDSQLFDHKGQYVHLSGGTNIDILSKGTVNITGANTINLIIGGVNVCTMTSSGITMNVPLTVNGTITATEDISSGTVTLLTHTHTGVTSGLEATGLPEG